MTSWRWHFKGNEWSWWVILLASYLSFYQSLLGRYAWERRVRYWISSRAAYPAHWLLLGASRGPKRWWSRTCPSTLRKAPTKYYTTLWGMPSDIATKKREPPIGCHWTPVYTACLVSRHNLYFIHIRECDPPAKECSRMPRRGTGNQFETGARTCAFPTEQVLHSPALTATCSSQVRWQADLIRQWRWWVDSSWLPHPSSSSAPRCQCSFHLLATTYTT